MDRSTKLIGTGAAGAVLSLLCCVTPVLAVLLGPFGFTAFVAKLDYVLVPLFVASVALVIFAFVRRRRSCAAKTPALRRHRIDPLVLPAQFLDKLLSNFRSDAPKSEILTGTAGYTAQ
jgi:mercuric ion transport protein